MKTPPAPVDLQRWSQEVARDPASLAFVPLARAYRKQGRRDAALRLCLRGLEHNPTNVDGHGLLAMLYFESGQRAKAYDEWSMVMRLEPDHFEALRGMGFYHLEQGDDAAALRNLQRAATLRPKDLTVQEALKLIEERSRPAAASDLMPWEVHDPWAAVAQPVAPVRTPVEYELPVSAPPRPPQIQSAPSLEEFRTVPPATVHLPRDPARLFDPILNGGQVLGALLVDAQGLVLAGSLAGASASKAHALGAILGGAIEEAARASAHLELGHWQGILLDADQALLHLAPVREGAILLLAAQRDTPAGWMLRSAHQAALLADHFLEVYA
ncbi:MAG: roadblock/LC7 domain-containing protein [Longimicrobiales bacterium]